MIYAMHSLFNNLEWLAPFPKFSFSVDATKITKKYLSWILSFYFLHCKYNNYYRNIILPKEFKFQSRAHKWYKRSYDWPLLCVDVGLSGRELKRVTLRAGRSWNRRETMVPKTLFCAAVSITHVPNTHHTTTLTLPQPVYNTYTWHYYILLTHTSAYGKEYRNRHPYKTTDCCSNGVKEKKDTFQWIKQS